VDAKAKLLQLLNDFSPPPSTLSTPQETTAGAAGGGTPGAFLKKDATLASTDGVRHAFTPNTPASFLLLLLNYLTSLRKSKNPEELSDDFCQQVKEAIFILHGLLSDKEQSTLHLERRMELFLVFPLGDVKDSFQSSLKELEEHRKQHHIRVEKEKLKKRLEEFKGIPNGRKEGVIMTKGDQQIGMEMLALVDPKKAARIKFHRQQKEARKKRTQSIQERNKMYRMIASDEISALFFQQAKKTDEASELEWGDDKLLVVEDPLKRLTSSKGDEGREGGDGEDQQSEASDDSFASKLKKVKRKVDTSLANVQFEPNKPMYIKSPGREEDKEQQAKAKAAAEVDTKSESSTVISELTTPANLVNLSDPTKSIRRESRILSWLMRNRGGG
jgi:hypothetical protein